MDGDTAPRSLRVLVVDDYPDARDSLALLLTLWGYEAQVAADGLAALALPGAGAFDVVLLDLGLPRMDGCAVARRFRALDAPGRKPLIVSISGHGRDEDRRRSWEAGCDAHLVKPV